MLQQAYQYSIGDHTGEKYQCQRAPARQERYPVGWNIVGEAISHWSILLVCGPAYTFT